MAGRRIIGALLAATALTQGGAAIGQVPATASGVAEAAPATTRAAADATAARIEQLSAQVEALQKQLEAVKASIAKVTPSWRGGPLVEDKDAGFSFKPKGTLQFDAGYVGFPNGQNLAGTPGGLAYNNLGFNARARRAILGAEGTLPGGFSYNVEFNLAQGTVDYEDIVLAYQAKGSPLKIQVGNFFPLSSLETMTSSRVTSFMERASLTDAFNYNRRIGFSVGLTDPKNDRYTLTGGLFSQPINDAAFNRTGWEAGVRGTYSPRVGATMLHLGASYHHRVNNRDAQGAQYRVRPPMQTTDQRFIDSGTNAADGDDTAGVEVAAVHRSVHFAAEAQKLWVRGIRPADVITGANNAAVGTRFNGDPSFAGGYVELGEFLTGETRGYRAGRWDRTKVLHPFEKGGWGAVQVNARIDYVDLRDRLSGTSVAAPDYVNGGRQVGYQLSLIWSPMDYLRFMAQYGHLAVSGGPRAVAPLFAATDATPLNDRNYGVDTAGLRAQLDF